MGNVQKRFFAVFSGIAALVFAIPTGLVFAIVKPTAGWLIAAERPTPEGPLLDSNYEELMKSIYSRNTNTRIFIVYF